MLDKKNKRLLLNLARRSIEYYLDTNKILHPDLADIPFEICEKQGVFVTLFDRNKELRGCIGYIEPIKEIWKAVIENAVNAAFYDSRFKPIKREELDNITIEISVLSPLKKIIYKDASDLLQQIDKDMGIVIKKGMHSATYLPDVWDLFNSKEEFMDNLCMKANLRQDAWENEKLEVFFYKAEVFSE